jgi:prepilin-type N-terminal cleavage/methylation domain-containing protein
MKLSKQSGFSLIELMIVVGIIGILATMAAPKLKSFQARAKQGEAKIVLNQIYTLQESHNLENNSYAVYATSEEATNAYYGADVASAESATNCAPAVGSAIADANAALGFVIQPCDARSPRYAYNIVSGAAGDGGFLATAITGTGAANRVNTGCGTADERTLNANRSETAVDSTKVAGC